MKAIDVRGEELLWSEAPDPEPGAGEVLLRVAATAVNRADLLQARGLYPPPPGASSILGLEAAGVVVEGAGPWRRGDRVMAILAGGGYAELAAVPAGHLLPIPEAVGLPAAGGLMEAYLTAYLNLVVLGELGEGERVLIHGGSGGVGTAALQLARACGAEVWTTCRAANSKRCLALGATRALDYAQEDVLADLRAAGGAALILDCLGAGALEANLDALAADGRLVVIGLQRGRRTEVDLLPFLARRLTLRGSTLRALPAARKSALVAGFRRDVWPLLERGELQVVVDRVLPLPRVADAHQAMRTGGHVGKLVLEVPVHEAAPG